MGENALKTKENGITEGVIWKQLLIFFFPILIGTFFQQLYNTVDTIVVGQYVGTQALAAVGTTGNIINLLVGFLRGRVLRRHGDHLPVLRGGDSQNVSKAVHTSMALALVGGLIIMAFGLLTARPSLEMLGVPDEIMEDAMTYLNVYYCGIIASMIYNVGTGVLRAIGDSRMAPVCAYRVLPGEHRAGPAVRAGFPLGCVRRGLCHGAVPGGQRGAHLAAAHAHPGVLPGGAEEDPL